jgi:hypothetical protein
VRFPSGDIRSSQWGLVLNWSGAFRHVVAPEVPRAAPSLGPSGLGASRMALTLARLDLRDERDGRGRHIGLPGTRVEWHAESDLAWGFETAGAASGGAAGYMEMLGTAAWRAQPLPGVAPGLRLGVRAAAGLGGGGDVPTGGGLIGRLTAVAEWHGAPWTLGVEAGAVGGQAARMRGRQRQAWVSLDLDDAPGAPSRLVRTEWSLALQRYTTAVRVDGSDGPLSTVGLKVSRQLSDFAYLSGQAHSAYAGGAGAFSIGLAGAGLMRPLGERWRLGAEVLLGAAGGGGVQTGGGALVQALAWVGWKARPEGGGPQWRVGFGRVHSLRGPTSSPLLELSWAWAFGQTGP